MFYSKQNYFSSSLSLRAKNFKKNVQFRKFFIKKGNSIFVSFNISQVQLGLSSFFYLPIKEIMQSIFLYCRGENVNDLRFLPYSPSKSQVNNYFAKASSLKGQIHFIGIFNQTYCFIFLNSFQKLSFQIFISTFLLCIGKFITIYIYQLVSL